MYLREGGGAVRIKTRRVEARTARELNSKLRKMCEEEATIGWKFAALTRDADPFSDIYVVSFYREEERRPVAVR